MQWIRHLPCTYQLQVQFQQPMCFCSSCMSEQSQEKALSTSGGDPQNKTNNNSHNNKGKVNLSLLGRKMTKAHEQMSSYECMW